VAVRTEHTDQRLSKLGRRLRALRIERGLSLIDVERDSRGLLKGVVVGSYERGDRNVSITRLFEIAEFYGVHIADLITETGGTDTPAKALGSALHSIGLDAQVTEWHEMGSATRGVSVRMMDDGALYLAATLEAHYDRRSPALAAG
jgi:transcriptional regulator with XRE-family HTH domain